MPFANGPILKLSKLEHLVSPLQISAVTRVLRTRVTLDTLLSRRHSAWLPTRIQHDLPLWIRTRTQSRLARNFTSQSLKLTQWNRQAHSSGMLPIVRSGPRQVKLVQTTRSSRTTPNADQSFWELQQNKYVSSTTNPHVVFEFTAFQFAQAEAGQKMHLQCNIKICLVIEDCQPTCSKCEDGY